MVTVVTSGNTIRLKATFYNFAGGLADLEGDPTLKIYTKAKVLVSTITTSIQHPSTGVYYFDRTTDTTGDMIYEFSGALEGTTTLVRGSYSVIFGRFGDTIL